MKLSDYIVIPQVCAFAFLVACAPTTKKTDVMDLYELPHQSAPNGRTDNDSYYVQPTLYKGCTVINDAPSCGGG